MSIAGAVTGTVVLLLRRVKAIPRRAFVFLWALPLLRFFIPFGVGSRYGLMSLISRFTSRSVVVYEAKGELSFTMMNHVMASNRYFPIEYKTDILADAFHIAALIWAVIASAIIIAFCIIYFTTLGALKNAEHFKENIYFSDKIDTPAVVGVIRPRIILPLSCRGSDLTYILLHERTHIKRGDNLLRIIGFICAAIHWFDPLVWVFLRCFLSDLELACDEGVLAGCGEDEKKKYALALLDFKESKNAFISAFGGAKLKVRIENILSFKKMTFVSAVGFSLFAAVIAYLLLTNAA